MIETVAQTHLAVGETLSIRRNHIEPVTGENRGRISVVTGMHGDELEGQFVCYELIRRLTARPEALRGTVDIYPVLNPLGMDSGSRVIPKLDMDMNRMFPGNLTGNFMDQMVFKIADSIEGSDVCIDVHASDRFVREIPQARISDEFEQLMTPYAKQLNVDLIWINTSTRAHDSTLANSLCKRGTPSLVIEMGLGNRIHPKYGMQIVDGILHLMAHLQLWEGEDPKVKTPLVLHNDDIAFVRAAEAGFFIRDVRNNSVIQKGDRIGRIIDPLTGMDLEEIVAECGGHLFTLREHPLTYPGILLARIIKEKDKQELSS